MKMTRKGFLGAVAGGTALLVLQACGGGDDDAPLTKCESNGAAISGNHGHALLIDAKDLDSMTDKTYSIAGTANHAHSVTLTPEQLKILKSGKSVTVTSSSTFQHSHDVLVTCV